MANHAVAQLTAPNLNEADVVEVTKVWLDGSQSFQVASLDGPHVHELVQHLRTAKKVRRFACGPSTPKYLLKFYHSPSKEVIAEVGARETLVQIGPVAASVQSSEFVNILERALHGAKKQRIPGLGH